LKEGREVVTVYRVPNEVVLSDRLPSSGGMQLKMSRESRRVLVVHMSFVFLLLSSTVYNLNVVNLSKTIESLVCISANCIYNCRPRLNFF